MHAKAIILNNSLGDIIEAMQNWNDELNEIMEKKMKDLAKKSNGNNFSDNNNTTMGAAPLTLNDSNFDGTIKKSQLIVVDFWLHGAGRVEQSHL